MTPQGLPTVLYDGHRYDIDPGEVGDFGPQRAAWLNRYGVTPTSRLRPTRRGYVVTDGQ